MADLTAANTARGTGLTRREGREIVVQHELLRALNQNLVDHLLVEFGSERHGRQRLRLTTSEDGRAVCSGQVANLAPDGSYLIRAAAVQTLALVENHVAHGLLDHVVVIVFMDQGSLLHKLLLAVTRCELCLQSIEGIRTLMLRSAARSDGVGLVVELLDDRLAKLLVVGLVAIGTLYVLAQLLRQLDLHGALLLDLLVGELDGVEHDLLRDLLHFTLDHQYVVDRTADHDIQIGIVHLREIGVYDKLAADARYAHLRDGAAERYVRYGQRGRGGQSGQSVGLNILVCRDQVHRNEHFGMVICRKERTQRTVYKTRHEHFGVAGLTLTFHETAGETAA